MVSDKPTCTYTAEQVAQRLNVGRTAIFARIKSGELASVRIGRSRRISDKALAEFILNLEQRPSTETKHETDQSKR